MKGFCFFAICLTVGMTCRAQSLGGIAEVTIIDRDSGVVLSPHFHRGEYWVAGKPGARYAIEIRNRLGERLLAVTSVDGVNVVSGETAGWDQSGYVFSPGEFYQITGWRKSDAAVAAFTFTDASNSYAERTGRPANVGVIGLALFRERQPPPMYAPPMIGQTPPLREAAPGQASAPIAGGFPMAADESMARAQSTVPAPAASPMAGALAPVAKLGTGHGEREYSYVSHTEFVRMQTQPNEVIRIHYDSLDNLFAMGIIPRPHPGPPTPNPFPASRDPQYVPDPPG
jgi:hypothetical protein